MRVLRLLGGIGLAALVAMALPSVADAQPFDAWAIYNTFGNGFSQIPNAPALNPVSGITLEAWISLDDTDPGCYSFVGKGYFDSYWLGRCDGDLRSFLGGKLLDTPIQFPTHRYVHVAMTSNGVRRRHYFDGAMIADVPETGALLANSHPVRIGSDFDWAPGLRGVVDEVRLWNVVRTQRQIRDFMFRAVDIPQPGLVAVWAFGPIDALGNHDGTNVGTVAGLTFPAGACWNSTSQACLDGRFRVTANWATAGDSGEAVVTYAFSGDTGIFSFFDPENWELMVKVLDGCAINNHYWVFMSASTDVFYEVTVRDEFTGTVATYTNPLGNAAPATTDITALPVCGFP